MKKAGPPAAARDILVVGAKDSTAAIAGTVGSRSSATVTHAFTRGEALERLKTAAYSHLLFDSSPMEPPPVEFVSRVRAARPHTVIVAVVERADPQLLLDLFVAGVTDYIVTPCTAEAVLALVAPLPTPPDVAPDLMQGGGRNAVLADLLLRRLDLVSDYLRHAGENDVGPLKNLLWRTELLVRQHKAGSEEHLRDAVVAACLTRTQEPPKRR
jgi:CheY-like chemotaxis protein